MTERDKMVAELRQQMGGIDPVLDAAEGYGKGIRAVQKMAAEQGGVMSAALENNAMLWELKKRLEADNRTLKGQVSSLTARTERLERELAESREAFQRLQDSGGDKYLALYEQMRKTLTLWNSDALDSEDLKERLDAMQKQKAQLLADGATIPPLPSRDVIDEHIADQGLEGL